MVGMIPQTKMHSHEQNRRVYSTDGLCPTIHTFSGGGQTTKIMEDAKMAKTKKLRIRKLTEGECYRFMGFEQKDTEACRSVGQSKANIYHQAGDSIVTTVLVGIFGELFDMDYESKIEQYCDKLHNEVSK